jgi:hypothetical protein
MDSLNKSHKNGYFHLHKVTVELPFDTLESKKFFENSPFELLSNCK